MRVAIAVTLALVAGCEQEPGWRVVDLPAASGIDLTAASGSGERLAVVGSSEARGVVLAFDGDGWTALRDQPGAAPTRVAMVAPDDVWIVDDGLEHWDGSAWSQIDLATAAGEPVNAVSEVWGSAADDVWVSVEVGEPPLPALLHHDGETWTRIEGTEALEETPVPYELAYRAGCSARADRSWIVANFDLPRSYSSVYRWDGSAWSRVPQLPSTVQGRARAVACDGDEAWVLVADLASWLDSVPRLVRWIDGAWRVLPEPDGDDVVHLSGLSAGWVVGSDSSPSSGTSEPAVWRLAGGDTTRIELDVDLPARTPLDAAMSPVLRAVWSTDSGRTFVFGVDGIALEYVAP